MADTNTNNSSIEEAKEAIQEAKYQLALKDEELVELAKEYEDLGMDERNFLIKLKTLKDSGLLDDEIEMLEQQRGKLISDTLEKVRAKARDLMKSRQDLNLEKASDIILEDEPELRKVLDRSGQKKRRH